MLAHRPSGKLCPLLFGGGLGEGTQEEGALRKAGQWVPALVAPSAAVTCFICSCLASPASPHSLTLEWVAPFHLSTAGIKVISSECTPCPLHLKQYLLACTSPCKNVELPVAFKCKSHDRWNWFLFSCTPLCFQCSEQCWVHSRCSSKCGHCCSHG